MSLSLEDLASSAAFGGNTGRRAAVTFLPEPEARERVRPIWSVDDHVVEPPDAFAGRFPAKFADAAPRVVDTDDGGEAWLWNGELLPNVGFNAVAGRPSSEYGFEPTRFDEMRRGAWDVDARVNDMDTNGVDRSLCFPSFLPGFVGQRLTTWPKDPELGLAAMRAYNDWHLDGWCGAHPDRFIPNQITWLPDVELAAEEVRRNAARGFRALTFSEAPEKLGLPSLHTGYWDPLFAACEETETVVCLHVGSSGSSPMTAPDAPPETVAVLFFAYGMYAAVDWLYSKVPVRFPRLKICLSEGGIGWVAGLLDRLDHCFKYQLGYLPTWRDVDMTPADVLRRNFWFCAIDDASGFLTRDVIGVDHILVESDYPHADSTWPDTQPRLAEQFAIAGVPDGEADLMCSKNAMSLFRLP
ncbi:MAG TPA: amidohydrolase family protein [Acidimicrobiia bacterium]|jgi:predicted TIM-barrel fold metal-dependent hydrolase